MLRAFDHRPLSWQLGVLTLLAAAASVCAVFTTAHALAVHRTLSEARAVADMAQHVGTWGSHYGGLAVHLRGVNPARAGSYLEQRVYASNAQDFQHLAGMRVNPFRLDRSALERVDAYYIKNPALIQDELAEIARLSRSRLQLRIFGTSGFTEFDAPDAFDVEALAVLKDGDRREYHVRRGELLLYARALHNPAAPTRIVSVSATVPPVTQVLSESLPPTGWAVLAAALGAHLLLALFVKRRVVVPLERMRSYADDLSNAAITSERRVPEPDDVDAESRNELDRLALAIAGLGASVHILFRKVRSRAAAPRARGAEA